MGGPRQSPAGRSFPKPSCQEPVSAPPRAPPPSKPPGDQPRPALAGPRPKLVPLKHRELPQEGGRGAYFIVQAARVMPTARGSKSEDVAWRLDFGVRTLGPNPQL